MITIKHPLAKKNEEQEKFLKSLPEDSVRYHELLFIYGNCAYRYHNKAAEFNPTEEDYKEWLEGLPHEGFRSEMEKQGFEKCKTVLAFSRYVMEKNDVGMEAFIKELMGDEVYKEYVTLVLKPIQEP
jgi:hypothetical protein